MLRTNKFKKGDITLLREIARGPGRYPTPAAERVDRLIQSRLVKRVRGSLRATIKGRIVALICD